MTAAILLVLGVLGAVAGVLVVYVGAPELARRAIDGTTIEFKSMNLTAPSLGGGRGRLPAVEAIPGGDAAAVRPLRGLRTLGTDASTAAASDGIVNEDGASFALNVRILLGGFGISGSIDGACMRACMIMPLLPIVSIVAYIS